MTCRVKRSNDPTVIAGLLEHLPECSLLGGLTFVSFAFRQAPIVISGTMGDQDLEVSLVGTPKDDTAGSSNNTCHCEKIRSIGGVSLVLRLTLPRHGENTVERPREGGCLLVGL